jgi:Flp pilus assembly protein TadD
MARWFLEKRDPARAEKYLAAATAQLPGDLEAWKGQAQLAERRRAFAQARTAWEAALRADPDDLDALSALGRISARLGDLPAAQAYFRQFRLLEPDDVAALVATAMGWIDARRADEALAQLDAWKGPPEARLAFARGLALEELRRWAEAAAAFAAIGADDRDLWATAQVNRAYALAQAGRNAEALVAVEIAVTARPEEARPVATRAWVLERLGRLGEAERSLRTALAGRWVRGVEGRTDLVEALARALARAGKPAEAVDLLREEVAAQPRDEDLLFALGVAQERVGDLAAALSQMRALLALSPDHAEALNFVGYSYAERGERLDEAERMVGRALELRPGNGYFLDSLGWIYYQRGDLGRAVTTLEQADALSGPEPTILEHLGDAYRRAQRPADAEKAYARALRSLDAGESQDGPERAVAQRLAVERKLRELGAREARPAHN